MVSVGEDYEENYCRENLMSLKKFKDCHIGRLSNRPFDECL